MRPGGGDPLDAAQAQAFVEQHDKHGGGVLDIEEFLRAMLPPAPAPAPLAAAHTPERTSWLEAEAALAALAARPQREGKYFTAHRSLLPHIEYTGEPVEAAAEFWPHHPNDGHPLLPEFVMVRLTDDQIREQRDLIRLSSYRWDGVQGVGPDGAWATPANYGWFLELCEEHGWIGWFDFMANVVVNVSPAETVAYMGQLYAECTVVPQGLYKPAALLAAMSRAWVFQETAFAPLDETGVDHLLGHVRALGEQVRAGKVEVLLGAFAEAAEGLVRLLQRRGWTDYVRVEGWSDKLARNKDYRPSDESGHSAEVLADMLVQRVRREGPEERLMRRELTEREAYPRDWDLYQKVLAMVEVKAPDLNGLHVLDYFTRPAADNLAEPLMRKLLTTSRHEGCESAEAFLGAFATSMLTAYGTLQVSYEADRKAAVTEVARSILDTRFGVRIGAAELLRRAWLTVGGTGSFGIAGIQPTIPDGERLLGLGRVEGTPILPHPRGNPSCYKTASGEVHTCCSKTASGKAHRVNMGGADGLTFANGMFTDAEGQKYHGFVCNSPLWLAWEGVHKLLVWRREGDPASRPAIVAAVTDRVFYGPDAAQEAAFD